MDDDQLLEAYINTLEKNEGTAGGDSVTDMSTRPYGVKDLLGVNPEEYTDDPRGLAKAVAQKHIDELKRMKLDWDNLPTSMKFNALDLQYNMGNLNTKAPSYYKNIKNGNYAAAIKESLDTIGAYDPKRKGERPTKGIALRRAMFYNIAAQDLELPTITNVNARNLNNKNKSARVTYTLSDDSKIPIKYTTLSLHSRTKPGTAEVVNTDVGVILRPTPTKKEEYTPAETVEVEPKPEEVYTLDYKGVLPDIGDDVPVPPDAPDEPAKSVVPTRPKPAIAERDIAPETTDAIPVAATEPEEKGFFSKAYDYLFSNDESPEVIQKRNETREELLLGLDKLKTPQMNKGGVVGDNTMYQDTDNAIAQQMEMFAEGGLNDEGGMVDEESGNEVPPGSLREEVRDDIPAQLSEGEFVFPADVVRYWGLDTLMKMRQKAKEGLARMEAMGQMGNADEATIPDDTPFDIDDLELLDDSEQDELNFNVGGVVPATVNQYGTYTTPSQFSSVTTQPVPPVQPPVQQPVIGQPPVVQQNLTPGFTAPTTGITPVTSTGGGNVGFTDLMPTTTGRYDEMIEYVNSETGERRMIPFVNGKPIYPIPAGFVRVEDTDADTTQPVTDTTTQDDGGGGRDDSFDDDTSGTFANFQGFDDDPDEIESDAYRSAIMGGKTEEEAEAIAQKARKDAISSQSFFGRLTENIKQGLGNFSLKSMFDGLDSLLDFENPFTQDMARSVGLGSFDDYMKASSQTTDAFAGSKAFGVNNPDLRSASLNQGRFQVATLTGAIPDALAKEFGITKATYNDMAVAGNSAMKQALGSLGFVNRTQLMDQAQASLVGKAMSAAHAASRKGQDVTAAVSAVLNSKEGRAVQDKAYATIKDAYSAKVGRQLSDAEFSDDMRAKAATYANRLKTEFSASALGTGAEKSYRSNVITNKDGKPVTNKGQAVLTKEGLARKTGLRNALAQTTAIADNARARQTGGPTAAQAAAAVAAGYRSTPKSYAPDTVTNQGYDNDNDGYSGGDNDRSDSDTSSNESGSGGSMGGGYGSVDDGWGGGD